MDSGSTANPHRYVGALGYYTEPSLGLDYVRARWLRPGTGSWVSSDPAKQGVRYLYGAVMPASVADPSGRFPWEETPAYCWIHVRWDPGLTSGGTATGRMCLYCDFPGPGLSSWYCIDIASGPVVEDPGSHHGVVTPPGDYWMHIGLPGDTKHGRETPTTPGVGWTGDPRVYFWRISPSREDKMVPIGDRPGIGFHVDISPPGTEGCVGATPEWWCARPGPSDPGERVDYARDFLTMQALLEWYRKKRGVDVIPIEIDPIPLP